MKKVFCLFLFSYGLSAYCNDDVSLTIVGYIVPKCGFTTENNNLTLSSNGFANTELVINCNSPMRVSLQSLNGGLRHQQDIKVNDYNVNWSILDANYSMAVSAKLLKSAKVLNVNDVLFNSIAKLQIELVEPLIYAGIYQDVIRIEMTPTAVSGGVR